jgi:hypothetical protein
MIVNRTPQPRIEHMRAEWSVDHARGIAACIEYAPEPILRVPEHIRSVYRQHPSEHKWQFWGSLDIEAERRLVVEGTPDFGTPWTWRVTGWPCDVRRLSRLTPSVVALTLSLAVQLERPGDSRPLLDVRKTQKGGEAWWGFQL